MKVGSTFNLQFHDGMSWTIELREVSDLNRSITFEIIESNPGLHVTSTQHTISLKRVSASNHTFIEWEVRFSNDVSADIIEDSRFKRLEGFRDLAATLEH